MRRTPLRAGKPMCRANPERQRARAEQVYGPGGAAGDYAVILRARPCDTCGRGRSLSLPSWEDVERLRLSPQSELSHVVAGRSRRWWQQVSQCTACHTAGPGAVHGLNSVGWGCCRELALRLAAALAWAALDGGAVPPDQEPGVERPPLTVAEYREALLACWPHRDEPDEEPANAG
jgi:hypothetical protein